MTKLDLSSGEELGSTPVEEVSESVTTSIAVGRDAVWFVGDSGARLWRIPRYGLSEVTDNSFEIGPSPSGVALGEDGAVWVASRSATSLWRLDPRTDEDETIPLGATSGGLVAAFDRIWTSPGAFAG